MNRAIYINVTDKTSCFVLFCFVLVVVEIKLRCFEIHQEEQGNKQGWKEGKTEGGNAGKKEER